MLTVLAFLVICLLAALGVYAVIQLGLWPKKAATARDHPYTDAINVLSWGGLVLTGGLGWLAALVWAYAPPGGRRPSETATPAEQA